MSDAAPTRGKANLCGGLVTNAVRYGDTGQVSLTAQLVREVLRIEVCDSSSLLPGPAVPDENSERGRGLLLVSALADRYGAEPAGNGKRCWAEIVVPSGSTAALLTEAIGQAPVPSYAGDAADTEAENTTAQQPRRGSLDQSVGQRD
ncbi:ATP-binding protein [Streptomyces sp. NPDC088812]|uniref:ATP-binding protein n=1 Tax=Streptomyces sp. NPDC088812 TaxID=3365905 RepID=UPI00382CAF9A